MSFDQPATLALSVTRLLEAARSGDTSALDRLLPMLYDELHPDHVAALDALGYDDSGLSGFRHISHTR